MQHCFSLTAKLASLDVGHVIFLEDENVLMGATRMERQVQSTSAKSKKLVGRKFSTTRCDAITCGRNHIHILKIERVA